MTAEGPERLEDMPPERVLALMAAHLRTRALFPVGSLTWAQATVDYEACRRELDRRVAEHVRQAREGYGDADGA